MGGFEGGDEAGFWDIDTFSASIEKQNRTKANKTNRTKSYIETSDMGYSIRAHAKVTVFLKITGFTDGSPDLFSRVTRVEELYDTIRFIPCACDTFTIEGCEGIPTEANSIYKAYLALCDYTADSDIVDFFHEHKVVVTKRIPLSAGLGGSSSDAAAFMRLLKEVCNLVLSNDELAKIGRCIGTDVPFFIYNYPSANVSGFADIVEPFEEPALKLALYTSKIRWDTALINTTFKEHFHDTILLSSSADWSRRDSKSIVELNTDPARLNDLYPAALRAYAGLEKETKEGWFLSGCSATFFKLL
jgi:4-diphosphocytidyl-2-C-methyl-D-erythritol kinase